MHDTTGLCIKRPNGEEANSRLWKWKRMGTPLDENTKILKIKEIVISELVCCIRKQGGKKYILFFCHKKQEMHKYM